MTVFKVICEMECPSDWDAAKAFNYVMEKLLSSVTERNSLTVIEIKRTEAGK